MDGELRVEVTGADGRAAISKVVKSGMPAGDARLLFEEIDTRALSGTYTVRAMVVGADGSTITENTYEFDVFSEEQLARPELRVAVLDPNDSLKPFLDASGIQHEVFDRSTDLSLPVFVSRTVAETPDERARFADLVAFVERGGRAVYLGGVGDGRAQIWDPPEEVSPLLPVTYRLKVARGLWTCVPHIVSDHPIFDGLPVRQMMEPLYENVWTQRTLLDVGGELIVGTVGFDWHPTSLLQRHYYGPGDVWWGADMTSVPHGQGEMIISQLRIVENLGKDPVADKILYNLVRYTAE